MDTNADHFIPLFPPLMGGGGGGGGGGCGATPQATWPEVLQVEQLIALPIRYMWEWVWVQTHTSVVTHAEIWKSNTYSVCTCTDVVVHKLPIRHLVFKLWM